MGGIAVILVALGVIGCIWGAMQKYKAGRIAKTPFAKTGDVAQRGQAVAGEKGAVSVEGSVKAPELLTAPVSGKPCHFYSYKVTASWKEGETTKEKILDEGKLGSALLVDDGSGVVRVEVNEAGDYDMTNSFNEKKKTGLVGSLTGSELVFGNLRVSTRTVPLGAEFKVEEQLLAPQQKLFVCGRVSEQGNSIVAPKWASLILSGKTREELLGHSAKQSKMFLMGGGAATAAGALMGVASTFIH